MKNIIKFFAVIAITLFGCTKHYIPTSVKMNYEQLSKEIGSVMAFKVFDRYGLTEADPSILARGRKVKDNAQVNVTSDIHLTVSDSGDIVYITSPNAEWGGCTKFLSQTSNDVALGIWDCDRWFNGGTPPSVSCHDGSVSGYNLRAFTSDFDYNVHLSEWITVQ